MKICTICQETKPLDGFYKSVSCLDGYETQCRTCRGKRRAQRYLEQHAQIAEYRDRMRPIWRESKYWAKYSKRSRSRCPEEKWRARLAVRDALRDGRLVRAPCVVCGNENVEAHHEDYSKPLDIIWLCQFHHRSVEGKNVLTKGVRDLDGLRVLWNNSLLDNPKQRTKCRIKNTTREAH